MTTKELIAKLRALADEGEFSGTAMREAAARLERSLCYAVDIFTPGRTDGPTQHHVTVFLNKANAAIDLLLLNHRTVEARAALSALESDQ